MTEPQPAAPAATLPGLPPAPSPALPHSPSYASSHPGLPPAAEPFPGGRGPSPMTPADETTWSTVAHLSWLAGSLVGLPVLGPLVLWLVLRERGPFVRHHTAEALNLQLSVLLYGLGVAVVGGLLTLVTFAVFAPVWALAGGVLVVAAVVLTVVGAVAASRGQWYRFPLTLRFVR